MPLIPPRTRSLESVLIAVVFMIAYPVVTYLVPGGVMVGAFMVIPITLFAWNGGERTGVRAAVIGIVYTELVFSIDHFLVRYNPITPFWALVTFIPPLIFVFIGIVVGRLSNTLQELRTTVSAKIVAETALGLAEKKYKDLFDHAPQAIFVIQDSRIVLCNKKVLDRTGYSEKELTGALFTNFTPPEDRQRTLEFHKRVVTSNGEAHTVIGRIVDKNHTIRWLEISGRKITWEENPAGLYFSNDVTERVHAERESKDGHAHLHAVLNAIPDLLFEVDREGRFYEVPTPHVDHLLAAPHVFIGRTINEMLPADAAAISMDALRRASLNGEDKGATYTLDSESGTRWFELSISAIGDSRAEDAHFIVLVREITERKNLEERFTQAQKMEAVGRLAGGIAHDFNNILMIILGYCDLIREVPEDRKEVLQAVGTIRDSAEKAASLTHQLLAFSRKQLIQPTVMDLNALLKRSEELLRRILGEDVDLMVQESERPCTVRADAGQLQQVVMNLAANARDAMPAGGRLTIAAEAVDVPAGDVTVGSDIAAGEYAVVTFTDTGVGMDTQTTARIFEPFFTTKEVGKGTGLGLSIVYGIIKQSGGSITVTSQPGVGTTFRLYLPLTRESGERPESIVERQDRGTETILLVEDENAVRKLILRNLISCGYEVLEAGNGEEAVRICRTHQGPIHLLLTDIVMPGIGGGQVAAHVRTSFPGARILLMTGYTSNFEELGQFLGEEPLILHKPFDMQELLGTVRKALEGAPRGTGSSLVRDPGDAGRNRAR